MIRVDFYLSDNELGIYEGNPEECDAGIEMDDSNWLMKVIELLEDDSFKHIKDCISHILRFCKSYFEEHSIAMGGNRVTIYNGFDEESPYPEVNLKFYNTDIIERFMRLSFYSTVKIFIRL